MLQNCAHAIYEEIGGDLEPDHKRCGTCKRSTILEVVTDAGRLEQEVRRRLRSGLRERPCRDLDGHPLVQACGRYDLIDDLIGPAFPYSEKLLHLARLHDAPARPSSRLVLGWPSCGAWIIAKVAHFPQSSNHSVV
jgi:hypothetical protein